MCHHLNPSKLEAEEQHRRELAGVPRLHTPSGLSTAKLEMHHTNPSSNSTTPTVSKRVSSPKDSGPSAHNDLLEDPLLRNTPDPIADE